MRWAEHDENPVVKAPVMTARWWRVAADAAFRNARMHSDTENTRIEHDRALLRVVTSMMKDDNQLFKQFMDNDSFKRWLTDTVLGLASEHADAP